MLKIIFFIFIGITIGLQDIHSQFFVENYVDVGKTNVSAGVYSNMALIVGTRNEIFELSTGGLVTLSNTQQPFFSGYLLSVSKNIAEKKKPLRLTFSYLQLPFSGDMREHNLALLAGFQKRKMVYAIGFNSRLYTFSQAAKLRYAFSPATDTNIWEPLNLMYSLSFIQALGHDLNLELRMTNFDVFSILQETNPMVLAKISYKINRNLQLYSNVGYLQAGLFNIRVNNFGYYFRGGLLWQIK